MAKQSRYRVGKDVNLKKEVVKDLSGKRITDRRVKQIIKQVRQQTAGRPSLTKPNVISPEVKARVPIQLKRALDRRAIQSGKSASELIRAALERYLL
ncbi:MAG: ribbon-helix-helix protein, CopG family [Actinobacteria bacterium]|nr:ribbon-helix-helix protein, CopG family [Actinomycetota bacterium]